MKKVLYAVLVMTMLFSLAACGGNNDAGEGAVSDIVKSDTEDSKSEVPAITINEAVEEPLSGAAEEPLSEALAWWDGEWYGYWKVSSADYAYEDYEGGVWDCYAIFEVNKDSTATAYWWDDNNDLSTMELIMYTDAGGIMGGATSENGKLFGYPSGHADWVISPNFNTYTDMIVVQEWFEDPEGDGFRYEIFLRPWGMLWDDVPAGERPPDYDSWYVGEGAYTKSMYDALYEPEGGVFVHPKLLDRANGGNAGSSATSGGKTDSSTGGGAAPDANTDSGNANNETTTEETTGGAVILDLKNDELKAKWKEFQDSFGTWSDITYEKVVELLGVEGAVYKESDNYIEYRWYASDDGSLNVQFNKQTGGFSRSGLNQYGRPD